MCLFLNTGILQRSGLGKIAMIKIDVEGAELEVLTSIKYEIKENHPIIIVEILPAYNKEIVETG